MTEEEKEKAIKNLVSALNQAYQRPKAMIARSFLSGLASGLGATIGVALVLTALGYTLRELGGLPFIGAWVNHFSQIIPSK